MSGTHFPMRSLLLIALFFIAGCASGIRSTESFNAEEAIWQGRLAVRVSGDSPQSFSAQFALQGNSERGILSLYTPLGSTVAQVQWSDRGAFLTGEGEPRHFETVGALTQTLTGAELPIGALFAWLQSGRIEAAGWQVERADREAGVLVAHQQNARNSVDLKLLLER